MTQRRTRHRRTRPRRTNNGGGSIPTRNRRQDNTSQSNPESNENLTQIIREVDNILNEPKYEDFVQSLGTATQDPKLRGVLIGGLLDGELTDDIVQYDEDILRMGRNLKPIQYEIDLEKSLQHIGQHPENVPLLLRGGTLGPEHFGDNPIIISQGQHIIDGHHRWSQAYLINPEARLKTINLHIMDPKKALRKSQTAIAALTGEVPIAKVKPGKNLYTMNPEEIKTTIPKYLSQDFYQAFYDTYPDCFQTTEDVHNYIHGNIMKMQRISQPQTDISRELMPQYTKIGARKGVKALEKGMVNIKPPYIRDRENLEETR